MASYSYVTPYQGQQVAPLPTGYMEAATAPGRNIGAGLAKFGSNVTDLVKEYSKNKAEDQYATSKIESLLAQYASPDQGPPAAGGVAPGLEQVAGIIGSKNLDAFVSGKANRMQKLAIANALETYGAHQDQQLRSQLVKEQLQTIQDQRRQQQLQAEAIKYAAGMPTVAETVTTNQRLKYPEDIQITEPGAPVSVPPTYSNINQAPPMFEALMAQEQARKTAPGVPGIPSMYAPKFGLAALGPKPISLPQVGQAAPAVVPTPAAPVTKTVPAQGPPELITEKSVKSEPMPYEATRSQLMKFLGDKGADAATLSSVDAILGAAGRTAPMRVTEIPLSGGGYAVNAGGKIEIVKPIEGKELTEAQSNALTFASRMNANEDAASSILKTGYEPKSLTEFSFTPERFKTADRKSYETAKSNWIAANLRKESGAAIGEKEYSDADKQYFPQAGDPKSVIEQKAKLRQIAFNAMKTAAGKHADEYLGQIIGATSAGGGSLPRVQLQRQF